MIKIKKLFFAGAFFYMSMLTTKPVVIYFNGSSSAGKSARVEALKKFFPHAITKKFDEEIWIKSYNREFIQDFLEAHKYLFSGEVPSPHASALTVHNFLIKQDPPHDNVMRVMREHGQNRFQVNAIAMHEEIVKLAHQGHDVIVDTTLDHCCSQETWDACINFMKEQNIDLFMVFVYCPLADLVKRVTARNNSDMDYAQRSLDEVIGSFASVLSPSTKENSKLSISYREITTLYEYQKQETPLMRTNQMTLNNIMRKFNLTSNNKQLMNQINGAYVQPYFKHDMIINTEETRPINETTRDSSIAKKIEADAQDIYSAIQNRS
ncbi:MAG: AAA family ATPase [Epsilonproteobacteria bacterium]|nr:AAA family ATPase [Campylobacterota bacterium]